MFLSAICMKPRQLFLVVAVIQIQSTGRMLVGFTPSHKHMRTKKPKHVLNCRSQSTEYIYIYIGALSIRTSYDHQLCGWVTCCFHPQNTTWSNSTLFRACFFDVVSNTWLVWNKAKHKTRQQSLELAVMNSIDPVEHNAPAPGWQIHNDFSLLKWMLA